MNRRVELFCAWSGPVLIGLMFLGLVVFAGFVPPPSPSDSADEIAALYVRDADGIRIGMVLIMIGGAFLAPWGIGLAHQLKKTSDAHPALTHIQVAASVIAVVVATSFALIGSVTAFRPDDLAPETTRLLNDILWFWWLIPWPLFSIWCSIVGVLILRDTSAEPVFGRAAGYMSLWAAVLYAPGSLCLFFKTGPFSYNGAVVWYVPTVVFFIWILVMTRLMIRATSASTVRGGVQEGTRAPGPRGGLHPAGES